MRSESLVLRNSLWIGLQPLILNVVSIFVTGYIARTLGDEDYGKFVFAFAFVAFFMPFGNLGLRAVTVRDIAANREQGVAVLGKVFSLRLVLACLAVALVVVMVNVMGYPPTTRFIVYIAGLTLIFQTAATTLFDVFQAYERMQYVAISNFISGTSLTIASVVVLMVGFRLVGLTIVYTAGSAVLFLSILYFFYRFYPGVRLDFDMTFWRASLKKGMPFFVVGLVTVINIRTGIILLSKLSGDAAVGQYGAAFHLVERLTVISESLCTAIFPTLALLFAATKTDELNRVLGRYANYLLMIGIPIAVGTSLLAPEIINLIFGDKYMHAGRLLMILSWNVPFGFFAALMGYCLGAIHRQPAVVKIALIATAANIGLCVALIPRFDAGGVAIGYLSVGVISSVGTLAVISRALSFRLNVGVLLKIVLANVVLAASVLLFKHVHWALAIGGGAACYFGALAILKAVRRDDWDVLKVAITRGKSA